MKQICGVRAVPGAWELLFDDEGNMIEGDAEGVGAAPNSAMLDSMVVPPSEALNVGQLDSELEVRAIIRVLCWVCGSPCAACSVHELARRA